MVNTIMIPLIIIAHVLLLNAAGATMYSDSSKYNMLPFLSSLYGGFLSHRGSPSHHPFLDWDFSNEINHPTG